MYIMLSDFFETKLFIVLYDSSFLLLMIFNLLLIPYIKASKPHKKMVKEIISLSALTFIVFFSYVAIKAFQSSIPFKTDHIIIDMILQRNELSRWFFFLFPSCLFGCIFLSFLKQYLNVCKGQAEARSDRDKLIKEAKILNSELNELRTSNTEILRGYTYIATDKEVPHKVSEKFFSICKPKNKK